MSRVADTMDALLETATHHADLERDAREGHDWNHVFTLAIFALFVGALLAAIVMGTRSYSAIQGEVDAVNNRRLTLDLVSNAIRACDATGAVGVGEGPEGSSLVLTEALETGSFETRFYLYEGNLLQEYAMSGTPCTPVNATVLAPTETFEFAYDITTGLLTVTTDQGSRDVALRTAQGSTNAASMPEPEPEEDAEDAAGGAEGADSAATDATTETDTADTATAEGVSDDAEA